MVVGIAFLYGVWAFLAILSTVVMAKAMKEK
jgi:hypothetical protein